MINLVAVSSSKSPNQSRRLSLQLLFVVCACWTMSGPASCNPVPASDLDSSEDTFRVSQLGFSEKLENPCALRDSSRPLATNLRTEDDGEYRRTAVRDIINELMAKTLLLRDNARTILRTNVLTDCSTLELPSVAVIPSAEELACSQKGDALRLFYTSLLNHTAHVYFISEQLQRHSADDTCRSGTLPTSAKSLSSHMRELMCILRMGAVTLSKNSNQQQEENEEDEFTEPTSRILNEELVDQPLCSRRSVRDCQTVMSTVTLLQTLVAYLERTSFDAVDTTVP